MARELVNKVKLQIPAGKATAAPPVGTALGPFGIPLPDFCNRFNDATKDKMGDVVPVEVYIYDDRSFDFKVKTSPAAFLIKKAAGVKKASSTGSKAIAGSITRDQLRQIAETKLPDLNAYTVEEAMNTIEGTAKNMGIEIKD